MCGILAYLGCLLRLHFRHQARQLSSESYSFPPTFKYLPATKYSSQLRASCIGKWLLSPQEDWDKISSDEMTLSGLFMKNLLHSIFCRTNILSHPPFYSRWCFLFLSMYASDSCLKQRGVGKIGEQEKGKGKKSITNWPPKNGNNIY